MLLADSEVSAEPLPDTLPTETLPVTVSAAMVGVDAGLMLNWSMSVGMSLTGSLLVGERLCGRCEVCGVSSHALGDA